jgi:hypothetical protein
LQAALPGAQQESDEDGEGEDAVASEIFRVDAMLGDEGGIMERLREIGEDCGMDTAKSVSSSFLTYQWIIKKHYTMKEYRKRGSGSGRAVYDDPRVAVEPLVLSESAALAQAETK